MGKAAREMLQNGFSRDETDRIPKVITITNLDIIMYVAAIVGHFVDLGVDINVVVRYFLADMMMEFGWTLAFILLPAFVNTAVSVRMYSQDKQQNSVSNEFSKRRVLQIVILVLQMAPILRFIDALIYALKSRRAERKGDPASQRFYYNLMVKEDSDAALLRIFECFLEAAPQHVLQTSLLFRQIEGLTVHQILSICSSVVMMGWCLAAYQRAIRYPQQDKLNVTWTGSILQTLWHFLVTLSRVISLSIIGYLYPYWTVLACVLHIFTMAMWLQFFDRNSFCSHNKLAEIAFSFALGGVYLFTYILPSDGRTRYRYAVFYTICFIENIVCGVIWYIFVSDEIRQSIFFIPVFVLSIVPYCLGIVFMVVYYAFFHPTRREKKERDITVSFKASEQISEIS